MPAVVSFSGVSKCYQLGLSRTSVTSMARQWIGRAFSRSAAGTPDREYWALRDVSFELDGGQSLALLGPNGAGKSTILKLLARITGPTAGRVDVSGQLAALIELGAGFHHDLTGRENVYLNGTLLGLPRKEIEARFDEIVAFAELDQFIDTPIKRYSSGMTVRLGFAVASCIEPDILLVDEVLAVGDSAFRQKCVKRIKALLSNGTSLIFVSHDMGLVKAVCDTAIYIEHGVLQQFGPVEQVVETYNLAVDRRRTASMGRNGGEPLEQQPDVEIQHVDVLDGSGAAAHGVFGDQAIEVRVSYLASQRVDQAHVVVRMLRVDGVSCFVARTSSDRCPITIEAGAGTVSVVLEPLQLFGGTYYAVVWIMDRDDSIGICRATSDWFEVKNRVAGLDPDDAVYEPARRWVHRPGRIASS